MFAARVVLLSLCAIVFSVVGLSGDSIATEKPHVVFVVGDHEYRSEFTMPKLAKELEEKYGMKCTIRMAQPTPRTSNSIPGLEVLKDADAAVFFMRWRELPEDQLKMIFDYVNRGGPVVAFRTTTHSLKYPKGHPLFKWNHQIGEQVCGQRWITHHGHASTTDVSVIPEKTGHPILKGLAKEFHCPSWLYVEKPLPKSTNWLLMGRAVNSRKSPDDKQEQQPVAWTWKPKGGRVFYTSLGHWDDFKVESVKRLAINAVHWVLGRPTPDWK